MAFLQWTVSVLLAVLGLADAGKLGIIGGSKMAITKAPYQISMEYYQDDDFKHLCGGSIINKRIILTAGHCVSEKDHRFMKVHAGSDQTSKGGVWIDVEKAVPHPDFTYKTYDFDVALLKLKEDLPLDGKTMKPITMVAAKTAPPVGKKALVTGFGLTALNGPHSDNLLSLDVPVWKQSDCEDAYKNQITKNMFCAAPKEGGKDACYRDSGGPLQYENKLIGVVSWGEDCAKVGKPGIYANVAVLRQWIDDNIKKLM